VVIEDPELLRRYADEAVALYLEEPPAQEVAASGLPMLEELRKMVGGTDFVLFHGASAVITIYATHSGGMSDCYLAAENLMLAAWAIGPGTCPIGLATPLFNRADVKAELGISPEWSVAVPIVIGHPSGPVPPTPRRQVEVAAWR
jgi:nitroreductase